MDDRTTHIASLVFARPPSIDFAACVTELDRALRDAWYVCYNLQQDHDHRAVFNIDSSRVVLAYGEHPHPDGTGSDRFERGEDPFGPSPLAACLTIAIGPGPLIGCPTRIANHARALLHAMIQRFTNTWQVDLVLWTQLEDVFTPDHFDEVLIRSVDTLTQDKRLLRQRLTAQRTRPAPHRFDQPDVERLMDQFEGQISARRREPPPAAQIASLIAKPVYDATSPAYVYPPPMAKHHASTPKGAQLALPQPVDPRVLRDALYPRHRRIRTPTAKRARGGAEKPPPNLPERLTFYTLNTTLMLVALPVGSAILVYNMICGEDLAFGTRTIAVTSTAVGLANLVDLNLLSRLI